METIEEDEVYDYPIDENEDFTNENSCPDPYEMTIASTASKACEYKFIRMEDVEKKVQQRVEQAKELFSIAEDHAIILLKAYSWNLDKLQQEYFEDDIKVKRNVGILPSPFIAPTKSKICSVCLNNIKKGAALACGHLFCDSCWAEYCKVVLNEGKNCTITPSIS